MNPRQLDPKFFYDDLGSALFDAICRLPWYPIARAELALLRQHAAEMLPANGRRTSIVELGCGTGEKLVTLLAACRDRVAGIHLVDISPAAIEGTERRLELAGFTEVASHVGPYEDAVNVLQQLPRTSDPVAVLFLGSNIGNFEPRRAEDLLSNLASVLHPGDSLLLGVDLVKPEDQLIRAYDDPLGVTAAFNLNVLERINRELGANFQLEAWRHLARWNEGHSRVEMHLSSRWRQQVRITELDLELEFKEGESIWTESSYKYEPPALREILARTGFQPEGQWLAAEARFLLIRARRIS
jgi:dimethylhistidine N-methyltransferase